MVDLAQILMQQQSQGQLNRKADLAQMLLQSGQRTTNPLVAALSGFIGTRELSNIADKQGALDTAKIAYEIEQQQKAKETEAQRYEREFGLKEQGLELQRQQIRATQANSAATRNAALMEQMLKRQEKMQEKVSASSVPGFSFVDPTVLPTPKAAEDLKKANDLVTIMNKDIERMDKLLEEHGTQSFQLWGTDKQEMEGLQSRMLTNYNKIAELGALAGADLALLENIIPDPTALFTSGKATRKRFQKLKKEINENLAAQALNRGFIPNKPQAAPKPPSEMTDEELLSALK